MSTANVNSKLMIRKKTQWRIARQRQTINVIAFVQVDKTEKGIAHSERERKFDSMVGEKMGRVKPSSTP